MESAETRICTWCGATLGAKEPCPGCTAAMANLPDPATMTVAERQAEFDRYDAPLTVPFATLHKRVEALVGRPVWTHEFALWDRLREEIASGEHPGPAAIMAKALEVNPNLVVVGVVVDDGR